MSIRQQLERIRNSITPEDILIVLLGLLIGAGISMYVNGGLPELPSSDGDTPGIQYTFDGSNSTISPVDGGKHTFKLPESAERVPGISGQGVMLPDGGELTTSPPDREDTGEISVVFWMRPFESHQTYTAPPQYPQLFRGASLGQSNLLIGGGPLNEYVAVVAAGGGNGTRFLSAEPITTDRWHQIALTFDQRTLTLYIDGEISAQRTGDRVPVPGFGDQWTLGSPSFRGGFDELQVYDRVLPPSRIRQMYGRYR